MMRKVSLMIILLMVILSMGCTLQGPESNPSFSVLPELLLDYDFDAEETGIWVKSALSDFKYHNITIQISSDHDTSIVTDNNTYGVHMSSELQLFDLSVIANSEKKLFAYECRVDVDLMREDLIIITTYDEITDEPTDETLTLEDLPYKIILDEQKEKV
jgi:hypothetical protein